MSLDWQPGKERCPVMPDTLKAGRILLVFYQFKQLMGAATQWFLSLLGLPDRCGGGGHEEQGPKNPPPGAPSDSPTCPPKPRPSSPMAPSAAGRTRRRWPSAASPKARPS